MAWRACSYRAIPQRTQRPKVGSRQNQQKREKLSLLSSCTQSRGRTGTGVNLLVFETSASTDSAIWASDFSEMVCKCRHYFQICKIFYNFFFSHTAFFLSYSIQRAHQKLIFEDGTTCQIGQDKRHKRHRRSPAKLLMLNGNIAKSIARSKPIVDSDKGHSTE